MLADVRKRIGVSTAAEDTPWSTEAQEVLCAEGQSATRQIQKATGGAVCEEGRDISNGRWCEHFLHDY